MLTDSFTWKQMVCANGCQVHADPSECAGDVQGAHILSQQTLKRHGHRDKLWDTRNGLGACERAHRRSDLGYERFPLDVIPDVAWEFADELGLTWKLERTYGMREAA